MSAVRKGYYCHWKTLGPKQFRRMGFVPRRKTTGNVLIPIGAQKEAELKFLHQIVSHVENNQIPLTKRHQSTFRYLQ